MGNRTSNRKESKMKAMFPKAFLIWLIDEQEIFLGELSEKYLLKTDLYKDDKRLETLDEFYEYWRLEVENKNEENENE